MRPVAGTPIREAQPTRVSVMPDTDHSAAGSEGRITLHCRRWARNSERLLRVVLRRSGWRWASYFNDSERARIEPYYVQNC